MRDPRMGNPTLVFLTDRNDLDDQLFGEVFAPATILPEQPVQADSRADLRTPAPTAPRAGSSSPRCRSSRPRTGDDANPVLTDRRNVVVVADEAHRSQYGFSETLPTAVQAGLAKHMRDALPGATFLGFTGTPIESTDKSTRAVFGDYIDVYDLTRAVEDGATVKIFYESRLAKVALSDEDMRRARRARRRDHRARSRRTRPTKAKSRWARLEAIVGAEERLDLIAARHRRALGEAPRGAWSARR